MNIVTELSLYQSCRDDWQLGFYSYLIQLVEGVVKYTLWVHSLESTHLAPRKAVDLGHFFLSRRITTYFRLGMLVLE